MKLIRRFILMLQFLTAIPLKLTVEAGREDYGKGLALAPVVGLFAGIFMAGAHYLAGMPLPSLASAVVAEAVYVVLTGGLHLDGLCDTADGLFSSRPREKALEIMKDSRVGANAVIALVLVIYADISIISSFEDGIAGFVLILMPVAGRVGLVIGAGASRYAGISDGPGRWSVEHCGLKETAAGLAAHIAIFAAAGAYALHARILPSLAAFAAVVSVPPVSAFILSKWLGRKLGGVTGDVLGAICELNQAVFLAAAYAVLR